MMKVICTECSIVEDISDDDAKLLTHVVTKYKSNPSPADYLGVLSIIKGACKDNNRHIFIFDESFDKEVEDTIKEYNDATAKNVERKIALEKICNHIIEISDTLKDLEKKKEIALADLTTGGILIENVKLRFLKLTGTENMSIWSKMKTY